jgi:hypothetical protein
VAPPVGMATLRRPDRLGFARSIHQECGRAKFQPRKTAELAAISAMSSSPNRFLKLHVYLRLAPVAERAARRGERVEWGVVAYDRGYAPASWIDGGAGE